MRNARRWREKMGTLSDVAVYSKATASKILSFANRVGRANFYLSRNIHLRKSIEWKIHSPFDPIGDWKKIMVSYWRETQHQTWILRHINWANQSRTLKEQNMKEAWWASQRHASPTWFKYCYLLAKPETVQWIPSFLYVKGNNYKQLWLLVSRAKVCNWRTPWLWHRGSRSRSTSVGASCVF